MRIRLSEQDKSQSRNGYDVVARYPQVAIIHPDWIPDIRQRRGSSVGIVGEGSDQRLAQQTVLIDRYRQRDSEFGASGISLRSTDQ